jgi:hypothetical protein
MGTVISFEMDRLSKLAEATRRHWRAWRLELHVENWLEGWTANAYPTAQRALDMVRADPRSAAHTEQNLRAIAVCRRDQVHAYGCGATIEEALANLQPFEISTPLQIPDIDPEDVESAFEGDEMYD